MLLKLKYFQKYRNVGDVFSEKVATHYLSDKVECYQNEKLDSDNLILIGSILEWADENSIICGSGLILPSSKLQCKPKYINCVRGPLSAFFLEKQGIAVGKLFGDPGLLFSRIYEDQQKIKHKIGIIPHYVDKESAWIKNCKSLGVRVIDVFSPLETFAEQLQQCEVILSSSLHGLVFAHSYGKPALWVEISDGVIGDGFKFYDYYLAAGISPEKVVKISVNETTNPYSLISFTQTIDSEKIVSDIEEALYLSKSQLEKC